MNVAFIHYHLKPGGVTTVISDQVKALQNAGGHALVLTGEVFHAPFPTKPVIINGLGYDGTNQTEHSPDMVASAIIDAIDRHFKGNCHLVHIHNPTLAKNKFFLSVLKLLQIKGIKLFLQIHDFAEDGRADLFFREPYPANCHYGVINRRDYHILLNAGLKKKGLHYLPNSISPLTTYSNDLEANINVVYPIRAIRRKNIGEAVLLSLFFPKNIPLAITLPPNSEADQIAYTNWKTFTDKHRLPVQYEVGLNQNFMDIISTAAFLITTSITEGFGFSFLESWTAGKLLWGRKLDEICFGFEEKGVNLDHLYSALHVPMKWIDKKIYMSKWRDAVHYAAERFEWSIDEYRLSKVENCLLQKKTIDFGLLNEKFQKQVIQQLISDPLKQKELIRLNPFLADIGKQTQDHRLIEHNKNAVLQEFNQIKYQQTLIDIYKKVATTPVTQEIKKEYLLSRFFNIEHLSLLKWATYED
jgi:hypothetical protein